MQSKQLLLGLAVIICLIETSYSIQCYICDSNSSQNCNDPFKSDYIVKSDCRTAPHPLHIPYTARNGTSCLKTVREANGVRIVTRNCYYEYPGDLKQNCNANPSYGVESYKKCEICNGNLCNGVSSILPISMGIILTVSAFTKYIV